MRADGRNSTVHITMGDEYTALLDEIGRRTHRSRTDVIRYLLDIYAPMCGVKPAGFKPPEQDHFAMMVAHAQKMVDSK